MKISAKRCRFPLLVACLAFGGCGGGASQFGTLDSLADDLIARSDELFLEEGYSDPGALPVEGSATYNGVVGAVTVSESLAVFGELELIADFAGPGSISGNADNFVDENNNDYVGILGITNGVIDRAADTDIEFTFAADIDGTLSDAADDYLVDGLLEGDFIGDSQEFVAGIGVGTVESSEGVEGFFALFIAEQ